MTGLRTEDVRNVINYAIKFEQAYASGDWTLIEPCFTPDAAYVVTGAAPLAGTHEGREAVLRNFKNVTDAFDRRFDSREVLVVDGPAEREGCAWFRWAAVYHLADAPDLRMEGESFVALRGDRIARLEDRIPQSEGDRVAAYFQEHGARFAPS